MVKIGFTGTQDGMTAKQKQTLRQQLILNRTIAKMEFHHGDCIGSDKQAHKLAVDLEFEPIIHPPENSSKRAFCKAKIIHEPKPYLVRNKDIVDQTSKLFATPNGYNEHLRSGTWSTIRYARKQKRKVTIIFPDGSIL